MAKSKSVSATGLGDAQTAGDCLTLSSLAVGRQGSIFKKGCCPSGVGAKRPAGSAGSHRAAPVCHQAGRMDGWQFLRGVVERIPLKKGLVQAVDKVA